MTEELKVKIEKRLDELAKMAPSIGTPECREIEQLTEALEEHNTRHTLLERFESFLDGWRNEEPSLMINIRQQKFAGWSINVYADSDGYDKLYQTHGYITLEELLQTAIKENTEKKRDQSRLEKLMELPEVKEALELLKKHTNEKV
jgi:hypothetical protein